MADFYRPGHNNIMCCTYVYVKQELFYFVYQVSYVNSQYTYVYFYQEGTVLNTTVDHVFTSIMETRHILRLRRNIVKLQFYNHLIYMLIFAVLGQYHLHGHGMSPFVDSKYICI